MLIKSLKYPVAFLFNTLAKVLLNFYSMLSKLNRLFTVILFTFWYTTSLSQIDTSGLSSEIKDKLIFLRIYDASTYIYSADQLGTMTNLLDKRRTVTVEFKKGVSPTEGFKPMYSTGKNLEKLIEGDEEAMLQFNLAMECLQKAKKSRIANNAFRAATFGTLIATCLCAATDCGSATIILLIGTGAVYSGALFFHFRTDRKYNKFIQAMFDCIDTYNRHIIVGG